MSIAKFANGDSKSLPGTPRSIAARNISFSPRIQFHDTWPSGEYDRRGEIATCNRLTPMLAQQIKEELNTFKMVSTTPITCTSLFLTFNRRWRYMSSPKSIHISSDRVCQRGVLGMGNLPATGVNIGQRGRNIACPSLEGYLVVSLTATATSPNLHPLFMTRNGLFAFSPELSRQRWLANSTAIHQPLALEGTIEGLGEEPNLVEDRRRAFDFRAAYITISIPVMVVSSIGRSLSVVLLENAEASCVEIGLR